MTVNKIPELHSKEWLYSKYVVNRLSTVQIASLLFCKPSSVMRALKRKGIETRSIKDSAIGRKKKGFKAKELNDRTWLFKKYVLEKLNSYEIASLLNTNQKSVFSALKFHKIPTRNCSEAKLESLIKKPPKTHFSLLANISWLKNKYIDQKLSANQIGLELGCSPSLVLSYLNKHGIPARSISETRKLIDIKSKYNHLNDRDWLYDKYIVEGLSLNKITKLTNARTTNSVRQHLIKFGIPVRNVSEGLTHNREDDTLDINARSIQVLNGCLLGDGGMRCYNRQSSMSQPYFYKKNKFKDHVELVVRELFKNANKTRVRKDINKFRGKNFVYYLMRSLSNNKLKSIYEKWYPSTNGFKKLVPKDIEVTPLVLLHWFMDDGCSYRRKRKYAKAERCYKNSRRKDNQIVIFLCSESFSKEDQDFLVGQMNSKFNLGAKVSKYIHGTGWRIYIPQSQAGKFFNIIGTCPVPSMKYKWKLS